MTNPTASDQPLTPPAAASDLALEPPEPVRAVETGVASTMVPLDPTAVPALDAMVDEYVDRIVELDEQSSEFLEKAESIRRMGDADVRAAASVSNRMLESPVRSMGKGGFDAGADVTKALMDLRRQIESLDPAKASGVRKLLGVIPFGDKLRDYFHRYESAQAHIGAILHALYRGQDELRKDNAALEQEKVHLWETMERLAQYVYVAEKLDRSLSSKVVEIEANDSARAKALSEDVLFYVRQKHQDLLTQLAVSIQGYLAIDLVRRNNTELIRGVDRATTTTIAALRTAVIVAQALANQKLVLDQITALNTTTSNLIESTSKVLASQSVSINEQAASSTIGIDKLEAAFTNIYRTMDAIETFKARAIDSMQKTIDTLHDEIDKAQSYLARAKQPNVPDLDNVDQLQVPGSR